MSKQICLNQENFQEIEKDILDKVMTVSKSMIETFKFKMIYGTQISSELNEKTIKGLKKFRTKNWDNKLNKDKAYKKYLNLY